MKNPVEKALEELRAAFTDCENRDAVWLGYHVGQANATSIAATVGGPLTLVENERFVECTLDAVAACHRGNWDLAKAHISMAAGILEKAREQA